MGRSCGLDGLSYFSVIVIAVLIWWSGGRACGWSCGGVRLCCWVVWVARDGYRFGVGLAGWSAGWLDGSGARWKWTMLRIPIQDGLRFAYPSERGDLFVDGLCLTTHPSMSGLFVWVLVCALVWLVFLHGHVLVGLC